MRTLRRTFAVSAVLGFAALASAAGPAGAAEPIMPLGQVQKGMHCTGRSVVSGVDIATFDVDILGVITGDAAARQPYILFRASGPAIDATGIGPGFSGSPISCPDAAGVPRVVGAISEGIGAYGGLTALATPIESILGEPVDPPAETRSAPALIRSARPLATPLSFGGLSVPVATALQAAARRRGAVVYAAPDAPSGPEFPLLPLQGGSAMAVGLSSGDVTAGAIGTVAYVDGSTVWAFGHPLDSAGRRSLFLQDAYVYGVIGNPIGSEDLSTYKYAAPGHDLGTLTNDAVSAVVGRLGALPRGFPLQVVGHDLDTGATDTSNMRIADETALGLPTGVSALSQVGAVAVAEVTYDLLRGIPLRQSGSMCVHIRVLERRRPLGFCNDYTGGSQGNGPGAAEVADFGSAAGALDAFNFGPLHILGAQVDLSFRRSLRQAYLLEATAPSRARRGTAVRVRVLAQRVNGPKLRRTISVRIPKQTPIGRRRIRLDGAARDGGGSLTDALSGVIDLGSLLTTDTRPDDTTGPRTVEALAATIAGVHRYDGVTASILPLGGGGSGDLPDGPEGIAQRARNVYRDPVLRLSGSASARITVTP